MNAVFALLAAEDKSQTPSWIWPEGYEIAFGGLASVIVFSLLFWKVGPLVKKGMAARTARIQKELDGAAAATSAAAAEAASIRQAKGDIAGERARLLADADTQATTVLADGRVRLNDEVDELNAKADSDIAGLATRSGDELRAEISRLSSEAADRLVSGHLDDATHQDLIEAFIAKVGASK